MNVLTVISIENTELTFNKRIPIIQSPAPIYGEYKFYETDIELIQSEGFKVVIKDESPEFIEEVVAPELNDSSEVVDNSDQIYIEFKAELNEASSLKKLKEIIEKYKIEDIDLKDKTFKDLKEELMQI
jgi:hypothetical protein